MWYTERRDCITFRYMQAENHYRRLLRLFPPALAGVFRVLLITVPVLFVRGCINMSDETLYQRVDRALDQIRPAIRMDGGEVELVEIEEGIAKVRMMGACGGCPMSTMTLKMGIERAIRQAVPEVKAVEAV
jgi:Fe-S cluster biogenesis protein NfuA